MVENLYRSQDLFVYLRGLNFGSILSQCTRTYRSIPSMSSWDCANSSLFCMRNKYKSLCSSSGNDVSTWTSYVAQNMIKSRGVSIQLVLIRNVSLSRVQFLIQHDKRWQAIYGLELGLIDYNPWRVNWRYLGGTTKFGIPLYVKNTFYDHFLSGDG